MFRLFSLIFVTTFLLSSLHANDPRVPWKHDPEYTPKNLKNTHQFNPIQSTPTIQPTIVETKKINNNK